MPHRLYQNSQLARCSLTFGLNDVSIVPFPHDGSNELIIEVNHSQIVNCYLKSVRSLSGQSCLVDGDALIVHFQLIALEKC